jgi:flagellar biosynthetic protein FliR
MEPLPLVLVLVREAAVGFALALALRVLIAGAEAAGSLIGFQMHLSYGATIDPQSGVRNPILAVLYSNIALVTFFSINGHHAFLRALRQSYTDLPVGVGHLGASLPEDVARMLGFVFVLGLRLAAPVVIVLLLVETALALLARSAPALNPMGVGAPVRLLVGFLVLAVVVPTVAGLVAGSSGAIVQMAAHAAQAFR